MLLSMSVLGADRQNWMSPIRAFATRVGPPAALDTFWVSTRPSTSSVSSVVPPSFFTSRMSLRSTFVAVFGSMILSTASTAIGASSSEFCETTFEFSAVAALRRSWSRSSRSTFTDIDVSISTAFSAAWRNASVIVWGWIPFASRRSAAWRSAPAMTTMDVVPSPASTSWALESSTIILAVGWVSFRCCRIVAPSLEIRTSPFGSWIILSIPFGPREVLTVSATALAARMFVDRTSAPFSSLIFCLAPSFDSTIAVGGCDSGEGAATARGGSAAKVRPKMS
mmetsp:Transcript_82216/g.233071  ORF Transcript_82216/g.233071 Transcript_82216/m.233071 type:complete len:281 (-) Transcript_82216:7-849(-)